MIRTLSTIFSLLFVGLIPSWGQKVKWIEEERLPQFGIHAIVHTVDPPVGELAVGNVYNAWFDEQGAVWLTSENGLYRWDGLFMERLPTSNPSLNGFRPYGIFPLEDGTLILTFTSALLPKSNIQALALLRPGSSEIEPFPMPLESGDPRWSLHRSEAGTFLIENSGMIFVLEQKPFRWRKVQKVQGVPQNAERIVRTAEGLLTWTTPGKSKTEEFSWVTKGSYQVVLQNAHPVRIPLAGRFDLFWNISLEKEKPLTLISIDPVSGKIERKAFESLGPAVRYTSAMFPLVFLTENTNELWACDQETGQLLAADLRTGLITRSFRVAGILSSQPPTCIITRGQDVFVGTSTGLVWIRTSPQVVLQQHRQMGSIRTFFQDGERLLWGTYTGTYLSSLPQGTSLPPLDSFRQLKHLKGTLMDFQREPDGSFWAGNSSEIYHFDPDKGDSTFFRSDIGDVWRMERWGRFLTMGSDGGVRQFDPETVTWHDPPSGGAPFSGIRVHGFLKEKDGSRIAYGESGIYRLILKGDSIVGAKPILPFLKDMAIFHVYQESPRLWWLCTKTGLHAIDPVSQEFLFNGLLQIFTGVPAYGILPDENGNLWVSSREGLVRIDQDRKGLYRFGLQDGLDQLEFNRNAFLKLRDGRMLFGSIQGTVVVDPRTTVPPPLQWELTDTLPVSLRSKGKILEEVTGKPGRTFILPGNVSSFTLDLRALVLPCPECRFAWRVPSEGKMWTFGQGVMEIKDIPTGNFSLESWKEVEGHWFRLPDIRLQRSGGILAREWLTVAGVYLFSLALMALVGFIYRSQLPRRPTAQEMEEPAELTLAVSEAEELASAKNWTEHFESVLAEHYHDPELKVGRMAAMMSVSERHLLRICREHTGMSPNEFLLDYRLRKAREDIMTNPLAQIAEVAYRSGFQTPTYFSRCFSEKFGKLPSKLQKEVLSGR